MKIPVKIRKKVFAVAAISLLTVPTIGTALVEAKGNKITIQQSNPLDEAQMNIQFPVKKSDTAVAINQSKTFKAYKGQGALYIKASNVDKAELYVNGKKVKIDTIFDKSGQTYKVDISNLVKNGDNTVKVANIQAKDATQAHTLDIQIPYPTVRKGKPEDVGINSQKLEALDRLIESEVEKGYPGGQLAIIKDGILVKSEAYGYAKLYDESLNKIDNPIKSTTDTLYDLASNSKMYAVNYAIQKLVFEGKLNIDKTVSSYIPEFKDNETDTIKGKNNLTVRQILMHTAGFPADPQYHNAAVSKDLYSQDRETTIQNVIKTPLNYVPGTKTVYSDVDYMLLGIIIEKIVGMPLDEYVENEIFKPLGIDNVMFNPLRKGVAKENCAATELQGNTRDGLITFDNIRTNTIQGEVHDEKAFYSMDGVSGHAGLFGNAESIATLAQVMINGGGYGDVQLFDQKTIDYFASPSSVNDTYGLGWRRQATDRYAYVFGAQAPNSTIGHTGWTGTLSVIDEENDLVIVWLGNTKHSPVIDNQKNSNRFYGNAFQCGEYGSIPTLVYESIIEADGDSSATEDMFLQMAIDRTAVINQRPTTHQTYADYSSLGALVDVLVDKAEDKKNKDKSAKERAQIAVTQMPDCAEKEEMQQRLDKIKK